MIKKHWTFLVSLPVLLGFKVYCKVQDWRLGEINVMYPDISVRNVWRMVYRRDKCSN